MVPTDIYENEVTGHILRDIAGLFTPSATVLQQSNDRALTDLDIEMVRCARRVIAHTESTWHRITP